MMGFVVPWMFLDVGAPLCPVLFATDAQGVNDLDAGGFGIVARAAPPPMIQRVFEQGSCVGRTVSRLSGDLSGLRRPERAITPTVPFTLLPADPFVLAEWLEVDICSIACACRASRTISRLRGPLPKAGHRRRHSTIYCGGAPHGRSRRRCG